MNKLQDEALAEYFDQAESWSADREQSLANSRRIAWIAAGVLAVIAILEAVAIVIMLPLKTVEPYTLLVDKQTGYVQALKPLERQAITPDDALVKSFLAQYVIAREGFDIDSMRDTYRKVALWSADEARSRYIARMQATNPESPLASLPRRALVEVQIRSISSLNADTSLVRFSTIQTDPGGQPQAPQPWAAVVKFRFTGDAMSAADRMLNPLGFQVVRYRRDPELLPPEPMQGTSGPAQAASRQTMPGRQQAVPAPAAMVQSPAKALPK